jgi:hypothetical protein
MAKNKPMTNIPGAARVASVAQQTGHGVAHLSPFAAQRKIDAQQAGQHSRDMKRATKLAEAGCKH